MRQAPILLSSTRYEREVRSILEKAGYQAIVCRPWEDAGRAYRNSPAFVAIVDARGALDPGLKTAAALNEHVAERGGGLLVLLSRRDVAALGRVYEAGATHYLVSPFGSEQLETALQFAARAIRRMRASGADAAVAAAQAMLTRSPSWRWQRGECAIAVSTDLAVMAGLPLNTEKIGLRQAFRMLPLEEMRSIRQSLSALVNAGVPGSISHDIKVEEEERRFVHHLRPAVDDEGEVTGISATVEDLMAVAAQQRVSMHYDALTGLASLSNVRARLDEIFQGDRGFEPAAVAVLIGISRLDQVNASHGRELADSLLQAVARRLRRLVEERAPPNTIAARLAGAEFAIVFLGPVILNQGVFFSQLAAKLFERPFIIEGRTLHLACRIGIAASEPGMRRADELLDLASSALAGAKEQGPNSFQVYLSGRGDDAGRRAGLEEVVREAANSGSLDIRYQPQVNIATRRIVGVEALVRYRHPAYGLLTAETLLATAERGEFGIDFGRDIMRQACLEAAAWPVAMADVRLSVNVTAADMRDTEFVPNLLEILEQTGFPPERLTLEITEGGLVENLERTASMLTGLKERRIRVAIDDFGTGYSSLAYLKSLPLDYLKIDKSIATDIEGKGRDKVIVRGVVEMARSLGMTVIAEGVETPVQLDLLVREGCNWYQGFLCSGALPSARLPGFVARWNGESFEEALSA